MPKKKKTEDGSQKTEEATPNLTVVEETIEKIPAPNAPEEPSGLDARLEAQFPSPEEEKSLDEKIEEHLKERGIEVEGSAEAEMPVPKGVRRVAAGTIIAAATGNLVLERDAFVKFDGSEQSFAGMLLTWHPANIARNRSNLRLKYDGNARVLPLAQQCKPGEIADFIPSLTMEEAAAMGVNRQTYQKYVEARNLRDAEPAAEEIPSEETETTEN